MTDIGAVFFIFNQKGADQLAASADLLTEIDCVLSVIPGISLDGVPRNIPTMTMEEALKRFDIRQRDITVSSSRYSHALLDVSATHEAFQKLSGQQGEGLRLALLNNVALLTDNLFAFELLFKALVKNGLHSVRCLPFHGRFRMIERLDIKNLLHVELIFGPQLAYMCEKAGIELVRVGSGNRLSVLNNDLRTMLFLGYKLKVLMSRSYVARIKGKVEPCNTAFLVRSRTEIVAAGPLLRLRAAQGHRDIMLVDDLIKSPDGTVAAQNNEFAWQPLHAFSTRSEILRTVLGIVFRRGAAARLALRSKPQRLSQWGFMGKPDVALQVLRTAFVSVPELLVYCRQLERSLLAFKLDGIVSFDTVDRWGAIQGELARSMGIRCIMVQNTALDDIVYPFPLSMDHMVVGNNRLKEIIIASGANPDRVHAFGLPLQDDVVTAGESRIADLLQRAARDDTAPLRIMVVTQPFVQEFDYNAALIGDLCEAIDGLNFPMKLVLKPHPRESVGAYDNVVAQLSASGYTASQFSRSFEASLDYADIVLSRTSTSLEFTALGGVPGIAYLRDYPAGIVDRLDYLRDPVTAKAFDSDELRAILSSYAPQTRKAAFADYNARRGRFLAEHFPSRGLATQRVAKLIEIGSSRC